MLKSMIKLSKNEQGFSAFEATLVLVIVALVGLVGWFVYNSQHKKITASATNVTTTSTTLKSTTPATIFTSGPKSGWETYTNNTVGFSITYPNSIYADSGCSTSSTLSSGAVPTTLLQNGVNFYIAAKYSYRFTIISGANQTDNYNNCTQTLTTTASIQAANNQIINGAQYSYSVDNLAFVVEKVNSNAGVQTELQNYWNDPTITISGWKNNSSGSYEVPTAINCSSAEESMMITTCGPLSSNYTLRYYPTQKVMFYFVYGQAVHLLLPNNAPADSQIINSFKVLN